MNRSTPGLPVHHQLPESTQLMSFKSVMPSSCLILCCPLLLLPPIPPSIRVFSNESTLHKRWPKYWSFSFSISPFNEHPGLISPRMDWLDLLADYAKGFDCVDHNKLWKILKEMEIPDHLTCLLRNLDAGQKAIVRIGHGTTDWFQIGKGVIKAVYCHPACLTYMQSIP